MGRTYSGKACAHCRQRHLKCDRGEPSCRRCQQLKITCKRSAVNAFRNIVVDDDFNRTEHKVNSTDTPDQDDDPSGPSQALFVDETNSVIEAHESRTRRETRKEQPSDAPSVNTQPPELSPSATMFFNHPPSIIGMPLAAGVHHVAPSSLGCSPNFLDELLSPPPYVKDRPGGDHLENCTPGSLHFNIPMESIDPLPPNSLVTPSQAVPVISHPREAYLLKVFTQTWGPIFDCLDPNLTFTRSVLHIAINSFTPLYWAILATSALQLSRVSNYPFSAARYYREQCSNSIMPILLQSAQPESNEETLFATYVLLRNYDHMTENITEQDSRYLFTASLAIYVNPGDTISDVNLGRAAFWVHLRQDIHVALLLQIPINMDYPPCLRKDMILEDMENTTTQKTSARDDIIDCAWANKLAILLVDIINYSFQQEPRELQLWISLRGRLDHWVIAKPRRFHPYYERAPDAAQGRVFPDIWMTCDCHVLAWLYYHTATILLKTYLPNSKALLFDNQPSTSPILDSIENREKILFHARAICGIAVSNPNAQALIVVCHMVTISAVFFSTAAERNETIKLIKLAHTMTGHPLHDIEEKLENSWKQQSNASATSVQSRTPQS